MTDQPKPDSSHKEPVLRLEDQSGNGNHMVWPPGAGPLMTKPVAPEVDLDELERIAKSADFEWALANHGLPDDDGSGFREYARAMKPSVALALISELRALRGLKAEWNPVIDDTAHVQVEEGKPYLFAIQVSTNGAPCVWEYWQDAIVWDAETEPDFAGDPGWSISDEVYFRELPSPPEVSND